MSVRKKQKYFRLTTRAKNPIKLKVIHKKLLEVEECVGKCYPHLQDGELYIDPRLYPKDYMDTVIHESVHMCLPKMSEDRVLNIATTITNLLWKLGYRKK
jgi:hypothetical protein